jgi:hypothetical protein
MDPIILRGPVADRERFLNWTDGSVSREQNKAGKGITIARFQEDMIRNTIYDYVGDKVTLRKDDRVFSMAERCSLRQDVSMVAELEAIEKLLEKVPLTKNASCITLSDSENAIIAIEKARKGEMDNTDPNAPILKRIAAATGFREQRHLQEWVFEHIYAHQQEHQDEKRRRKAEKANVALANKIIAKWDLDPMRRSELINLCIAGNDATDELAKLGAEEAPFTKETVTANAYKHINQITWCIENYDPCNMITGKMSRYITKIWQEKQALTYAARFEWSKSPLVDIGVTKEAWKSGQLDGPTKNVIRRARNDALSTREAETEFADKIPEDGELRQKGGKKKNPIQLNEAQKKRLGKVWAEKRKEMEEFKQEQLEKRLKNDDLGVRTQAIDDKGKGEEVEDIEMEEEMHHQKEKSFKRRGGKAPKAQPELKKKREQRSVVKILKGSLRDPELISMIDPMELDQEEKNRQHDENMKRLKRQLIGKRQRLLERIRRRRKYRDPKCIICNCNEIENMEHLLVRCEGTELARTALREYIDKLLGGTQWIYRYWENQDRHKVGVGEEQLRGFDPEWALLGIAPRRLREVLEEHFELNKRESKRVAIQLTTAIMAGTRIIYRMRCELHELKWRSIGAQANGVLDPTRWRGSGGSGGTAEVGDDMLWDPGGPAVPGAEDHCG